MPRHANGTLACAIDRYRLTRQAPPPNPVIRQPSPYALDDGARADRAWAGVRGVRVRGSAGRVRLAGLLHHRGRGRGGGRGSEKGPRWRAFLTVGDVRVN